jgi:phytoene synthase
MMSYVIGFKEGALPYAQKLGYAMQLTNFVRDIREDLEELGRVYLPEEDLKKFGVQKSDLEAGKVTDSVRELLKYEIWVCRTLYRESDAGIALLDPRGRFAVRAASRIYEGILDNIEKHDFDVFSSKRGFGKGRKIWELIKTRIGL